MSAVLPNAILEIYRGALARQLAESSFFFDQGPPIYGPPAPRCWAEWDGCEGPSCGLVPWHEGPHCETDYDGRRIWWDR